MPIFNPIALICLCLHSVFGYSPSDTWFKIPIQTGLCKKPVFYFTQKSIGQSSPENFSDRCDMLSQHPSDYHETIGLQRSFEFDSGSSSLNYSFELNPNRSDRIPLLLLSTSELAFYFAVLGYSRKEILDQYQWFMSDLFIDLVKDFPEYETMLKKHCKRFLKYTFGKKLLEFFKGNYRPGLAKRLQKLCDRLITNDPPNKPVPSKISLKKTDLELIIEWNKGRRLHEQYFSATAHRFNVRIQALADSTMADGRSAIERLLLQEASDLSARITAEAFPIIAQHKDSLCRCIGAATKFVQLKQFKVAAIILDFCSSFVELATAIVQAAVQGLTNLASHARDDPVEFTVELAASIVAPKLLCAYHALQLICYCAPTVKDLAYIGVTALGSPTQGLKDFKSYITPLINFVEQVRTKEIALTQLIESGVVVAAEIYAQQQLYGGVARLYGSIIDKATTWVGKNRSFKFAHYLKTPEGILFKASQGTGDSVPKERFTQTLNRTEDFFTMTEFGKANKQYFVKLKHPPIQGKSIFTALCTVNEQIKKNFSIALDALHKNHLELYDAKGLWTGALNFDGTLNHSFTKRGQLKSKKPIKKG